MVRILIVDDHELVRAGFARILGDEPGLEVVGEVDNGEAALRFVRHEVVDVVLLDIRMPNMDGHETLQRMLRINDRLRIVAVTSLDDVQQSHRFMRDGAAGFLTKGSDPAELIRAVKVVAGGKRFVSAHIAQEMALTPYEDDGPSDLFALLSERERRVAHMIINCERVADISRKLGVNNKTVNTFRYRIFEKLGVSSDVELTLLAIRCGKIDANGALKDSANQP